MDHEDSGARRRTLLVGLAWAGASVLCWGAMFPAGRRLMTDGALAPSAVAMLRYLLAAPALLAAAFFSRGRAAVPRGVRDWGSVALFGLVGSALMAWLLFIAQESIPSINASLLEAYVPIQVLLLGVFAGHLPRPRQTLAVALGFLGSMLVLGALDGSGLRLGTLSRGDLLIFLSGLCWSVYTAWGRPCALRLGGVAFTAWTVLFGGLWLLAWNLAMLPAGAPLLPHGSLEWKLILFLAIFPTGIAFLGWNEAQRHLSLSTLSFLEYFTPLVAALTGLFYLGEPVTAWQWAGTALVILSARFL